MNALLIRMMRMTRRSAPIAAAAAAAALSIGAYSGSAHGVRSVGRSHTFSLRLSTKVARISPGGSAWVAVIVHRHHLPGRVRLRIASRLPRGLKARVTLAKLRGRRSILTLRATTRLRSGRYVLRVRAAVGRKRKTAKLTLTVALPAGAGSQPVSGTGSGTNNATSAFSISGDAGAPLQPGIAQPIDLEIHNPNSGSLTLSRLSVVVSRVAAPQASAALPCTASDFYVEQYSGLFPLVVAPESTVSLAQLGVPPGEWPQVSMIDRPTNQDGCQGASLSLKYDAAASLG